MWRTVIVSRGERLSVKDNWLIVSVEGKDQRIPIDDLYSVLIDNRSASVSVSVMTQLTEAGVHVLFCNEKHIPTAIAIPYNLHYRPYGVLKKQIAMTDEFKDKLWKKIVKQKLLNQAACLHLASFSIDKVENMKAIADSVVDGDKKNREGMAARVYFQTLFGPGFVRGYEDVTNAALNYGYTILRSSICKSLAVYGYNGALGIHHIGETNSFNLADDLIEPFRPVVDLWVDENFDNLYEELTKENRNELVAIVNEPMKLAGKKMRIRYIIDRVVASLTSAIDANNPDKILLPELINLDKLFEDELDGQIYESDGILRSTDSNKS